MIEEDQTADGTGAPARVQALLDALPPPLEPMGASALDGFLVGVLLQPRAVPAARWLPYVADAEGRAAAPGRLLAELAERALARHAALDRAIQARAWFDPWIFAGDDESADDGASDLGAVVPWVAGFAAAMDAFPALLALDEPALVEPLALLYRHFDPDDLEDTDTLLEVIESLEPPADLAEAVEDLVRATLLMADVARPRAAPVRHSRPRPPRSR
jgi:uncharacterized protein